MERYDMTHEKDDGYHAGGGYNFIPAKSSKTLIHVTIRSCADFRRSLDPLKRRWAAVEAFYSAESI